MRSRASARVVSVITSGMTSGRGNARDQFGRGNGLLLRNATNEANVAEHGTSFKLVAIRSWGTAPTSAFTWGNVSF
jgi:hypothetical protein